MVSTGQNNRYIYIVLLEDYSMDRVKEKCIVDGYGMTTLVQSLGKIYKRYECRWINTIELVHGKRTYSANRLGKRMTVLAEDLQTALDYVTITEGKRPNIIRRI